MKLLLRLAFIVLVSSSGVLHVSSQSPTDSLGRIKMFTKLPLLLFLLSSEINAANVWIPEEPAKEVDGSVQDEYAEVSTVFAKPGAKIVKESELPSEQGFPWTSLKQEWELYNKYHKKKDANNDDESGEESEEEEEDEKKLPQAFYGQQNSDDDEKDHAKAQSKIYKKKKAEDESEEEEEEDADIPSRPIRPGPDPSLGSYISDISGPRPSDLHLDGPDPSGYNPDSSSPSGYHAGGPGQSYNSPDDSGPGQSLDDLPPSVKQAMLEALISKRNPQGDNEDEEESDESGLIGKIKGTKGDEDDLQDEGDDDGGKKKGKGKDKGKKKKKKKGKKGKKGQGHGWGWKKPIYIPIPAPQENHGWGWKSHDGLLEQLVKGSTWERVLGYYHHYKDEREHKKQHNGGVEEHTDYVGKIHKTGEQLVDKFFKGSFWDRAFQTYVHYKKENTGHPNKEIYNQEKSSLPLSIDW